METDVQTPVVEYARARGCIALKVTVTGQKGWPDYLFITPKGKHFWIEFKDAGKTLRKLQEYRMSALMAHNVNVFEVDNQQEGVCLVEDMVTA